MRTINPAGLLCKEIAVARPVAHGPSVVARDEAVGACVGRVDVGDAEPGDVAVVGARRVRPQRVRREATALLGDAQSGGEKGGAGI